jgi:hypothetical protein
MPEGVPEHLLIPLDASREGPTEAEDFDHYGCWCGEPGCKGRNYRILATGSRDWDNPGRVYDAITDFAVMAKRAGWPGITVVHGACPTGADLHASRWCRVQGFDEEKHPADWTRYGKSAGPRRNREMVKAGADVHLAFIKNESKGATGTAGMAEKAGIAVKIWRS